MSKRFHLSLFHPPDMTSLFNPSTASPLAYYSPLLLLTIPGTRNDDPRWDAGTILDVVLFCLSQQNKRRKGSGINLLSQVRGNNLFLFLGDLLISILSLANRLDVHDPLRSFHVCRGTVWTGPG